MKAVSTEWYEDNERVLKSRPETFPDKRNRLFMVVIHEQDFSTPDQVGIGHRQGSILPGIWLWNDTLVDFI